LVPNVITYNALISACGKGKQPERALELFEAMQRQGLVPNVITSNALMCASEGSHLWELALDLPFRMQQHEVMLDEITHLLVFRSMLLRGEWAHDHVVEYIVMTNLGTNVKADLLRPIFASACVTAKSPERASRPRSGKAWCRTSSPTPP